MGSFSSDTKEEKNQKLKESLSVSLKENNDILYMYLLRANSKPEKFIAKHADNRGTICNDKDAIPVYEANKNNDYIKIDDEPFSEDHLYYREAYPGLGTVKKLSIMHYLELIGKSCELSNKLFGHEKNRKDKGKYAGTVYLKWYDVQPSIWLFVVFYYFYFTV